MESEQEKIFDRVVDGLVQFVQVVECGNVSYAFRSVDLIHGITKTVAEFCPWWTNKQSRLALQKAGFKRAHGSVNVAGHVHRWRGFVMVVGTGEIKQSPWLRGRYSAGSIARVCRYVYAEL